MLLLLLVLLLLPLVLLMLLLLLLLLLWLRDLSVSTSVKLLGVSVAVWSVPVHGCVARLRGVSASWLVNGLLYANGKDHAFLNVMYCTTV